jgi:hypothetical protein
MLEISRLIASSQQRFTHLQTEANKSQGAVDEDSRKEHQDDDAVVISPSLSSFTRRRPA